MSVLANVAAGFPSGASPSSQEHPFNRTETHIKSIHRKHGPKPEIRVIPWLAILPDEHPDESQNDFLGFLKKRFSPVPFQWRQAGFLVFLIRAAMTEIEQSGLSVQFEEVLPREAFFALGKREVLFITRSYQERDVVGFKNKNVAGEVSPMQLRFAAFSSQKIFECLSNQDKRAEYIHDIAKELRELVLSA